MRCARAAQCQLWECVHRAVLTARRGLGLDTKHDSTMMCVSENNLSADLMAYLCWSGRWGQLDKAQVIQASCCGIERLFYH